MACYITYYVHLLACTIFSSNYYFVICYMVRFIWLHQHPDSVCKLVSPNYCFQAKSSFKDRVIVSILGKSSDVAFRISVSESSFYSIYIAVTFYDRQQQYFLRPLPPSCLLYDCKVKRFHKIFLKTRWKFVYKPTMPCNSRACWMGWLGGRWTYWEFSICCGIILKSINHQ